MPLNNIRRWTPDGFISTTPSAAQRLYPHTVSASANVFVCYNCYHYVTFVNAKIKTEFRHSSGDADKECVDRTKSLSVSRQQYLKKTLTAPMRLRWDGTRCGLDIGLLPISHSELALLERNHAEVRILSEGKIHAVYKIDPSFLTPGSTRWIPISSSLYGKILLSIMPSSIRFPTWEMPYAPVDPKGTFFDATTGDRLPLQGDVVVNHDYYLLTRRCVSSAAGCDISIIQLTAQTREGWRLYRICAKQMSANAAAFFIDYHLLLTNMLTRLVPLWPPLIEHDHLLDTNQRRIWMMLEGDADVEGYPNGGKYIHTAIDNSKGRRIIQVDNTGRVQIVWAAKSSVLRYVYLRQLTDRTPIIDAEVSVTDDTGRTIENELQNPPVHGILHIRTDVDGKAQIFDSTGLLCEEKIEAGKEKRLMNLHHGQRIIIRQGCEISREIVISEKNQPTSDKDLLQRWNGADVAFDLRYAWLLKRMSKSSELYRRTLSALKKGKIPFDGLKTLTKMMGVNHSE